MKLGLQIMHNGAAIELLHRISTSVAGELWRVKPLFVEEPDRDVFIRFDDKCTRLHSERRA